MKIKAEFIFPAELKDEPLICQICKDFNIVLSIVEASFSTETGWAILVLEAEEAELEMNESAGAGKIAWTNVKLWFTFGQEKKAQVELQLAKLQLIRAKIAAKNNDSQAVEKALEAHERIIERVKARINAIDGADTEKEANATVAKLRGLERAIQVHERRITFLNNVLENANLTDAQRAKIEAKLGKLGNVTAQLTELSEARQERIKTKLMATQNLTEEEAEQVMEKAREKISDDSTNESEDETESESEED